jgi:hypothetical protein
MTFIDRLGKLSPSEKQRPVADNVRQRDIAGRIVEVRSLGGLTNLACKTPASCSR